MRFLRFLPVALLCAAAALLHAGVASGPTSVTLAWNPQPQLDSNAVFNLYGSTNVSLPVSQWMYLTSAPAATVSGTNSWPTTNLTVTMTPGVFFFYLTASNFWGESGPSNQAGTPAVPVTVTNVNIHR